MRSTISSDLLSDRDPGAGRDDLQTFVLAAVGVLVFMIVFIFFCHPYDLATGMFFSFALGLLARGKLLQYLAVFALANLNRETAFLLTMVFAAFFLFRLPWRQYVLWILLQGLIFAVIRVGIMGLYAGSPGSDALVQPLKNLLLFVRMPWLSILHWAGFALVIWLCARRWQTTPRLLQVALAVMLPVQMVLYLVLGLAFEIRVFAEVYPVIWAVAWKV